jgi:hypothetical protein
LRQRLRSPNKLNSIHHWHTEIAHRHAD